MFNADEIICFIYEWVSMKEITKKFYVTNIFNQSID